MGGKAELQQLRSILSLSYGPLGAGAMFQPTPGRGHVTCTATSQRLLPMLMTSSPVGRLVVDSLATHSQTYRDCGLFAGLLATDLILSGLDLGLPQHQVSLVTSHALSLVTNLLMTKGE
ncbi:McKusick-Kaufman/Bardet-Biedl syndromes putative chaperonin, partial [Geodia barretti]